MEDRQAQRSVCPDQCSMIRAYQYSMRRLQCHVHSMQYNVMYAQIVFNAAQSNYIQHSMLRLQSMQCAQITFNVVCSDHIQCSMLRLLSMQRADITFNAVQSDHIQCSMLITVNVVVSLQRAQIMQVTFNPATVKCKL